ncbi:hypothetical protein BZA70DRAFT_265672 [Myxozyma melibiosi]|uniref:Uncharacterized protein n=1 Tax=Myxozyma melibiosi TaxID=54550 RepID=A0ABR1FEX2_9ASCO
MAPQRKKVKTEYSQSRLAAFADGFRFPRRPRLHELMRPRPNDGGGDNQARLSSFTSESAETAARGSSMSEVGEQEVTEDSAERREIKEEVDVWEDARSTSIERSTLKSEFNDDSQSQSFKAAQEEYNGYGDMVPSSSPLLDRRLRSTSSEAGERSNGWEEMKRYVASSDTEEYYQDSPNSSPVSDKILGDDASLLNRCGSSPLKSRTMESRCGVDDEDRDDISSVPETEYDSLELTPDPMSVERDNLQEDITVPSSQWSECESEITSDTEDPEGLHALILSLGSPRSRHRLLTPSTRLRKTSKDGLSPSRRKLLERTRALYSPTAFPSAQPQRINQSTRTSSTNTNDDKDAAADSSMQLVFDQLSPLNSASPSQLSLGEPPRIADSADESSKPATAKRSLYSSFAAVAQTESAGPSEEQQEQPKRQTLRFQRNMSFASRRSSSESTTNETAEAADRKLGKACDSLLSSLPLPQDSLFSIQQPQANSCSLAPSLD